MITQPVLKNYCIGIIPSSSSFSSIIELKNELEKKHHIKSIRPFLPNIKLIEPFYWDEKNEYLLIDSLKKYASQSFSFELEFSGFKQTEQQFYLKILDKNNISNFQRSLKYFLEIHNKIVFENYAIDDFDPLINLEIEAESVRKSNKIWNDLKENSFHIHFIANKISLLSYNSECCEVLKEFELE